ncbi:SH3 domain-containing protein [Ophiocordyceps camponoti-floridani]|uniref:SH3 domain-containing protein n=1 Tax=Ophiocordyceps camponoti-floridani TaxID=2030778 RepID=A0A8H4VD97_9HYPO|nr:SH3 domain-containing protein [Ophiocordyceps camponoti-floridani]
MRLPAVCEASGRSLRGGVAKRHFATRRHRRKELAVVAALASLAAAQADGGCVSLRGSKACAAFQSASVSTRSFLNQSYPFLQFVSDSSSLDNELTEYIKTSYVRDKYQNLLGCGGVNLTDPSNMYARFTTTVLCNVLVQQSIGPCQLSQDDARPVCADTCADFARSEAFVTADQDLCSHPNADLNKLIRADFTTCSLPDGALSGRCVAGVDNEPENCGFGNSTIGLCSYCAAGGINSTDTCCYSANAESRCQGVRLPTVTPTLTFSTPAATSSSTGTARASLDDADDDDRHRHHGLSGGAIAGIVIGSVVGLMLLALLLLFCIRMTRRRKGSQQGSIFNQPSPARKGPTMAQMKQQTPPEGYEVLPGGRVTRMSALEGHSSRSQTQQNAGLGIAGGAAAAAAAGHRAARHQAGEESSPSDSLGDSPESAPRGGMIRPPAAARRQGSLSSGSLLQSEGRQSPSGNEQSSPAGMGSQDSEQLPFFKDYYSQDDIHPGDRVAVLWAYQPRAVDEFALERGDMLKVVGIWDDGWATGVMVDERADEWEARRQAQRDSGVSNTVTEPRNRSPVSSQLEMKAFPLVCVCLPEHWRKTIEGDGSTDSAPEGTGNTPPKGGG